MKSFVLKGTISEVIEDIKDKRWKQDICYIGHLKKDIELLKHENEELKKEISFLYNLEHNKDFAEFVKECCNERN